MGCGGTKVAPSPKQKKEKPKYDIYAVCRKQDGLPNLYDRKLSRVSGGEVLEERGTIGRGFQMQAAYIRNAIVDTYKDMKWGKAEEDPDRKNLSAKTKERICLWLNGLPAQNNYTAVRDMTEEVEINNRPGTPPDYYTLPRHKARRDRLIAEKWSSPRDNDSIQISSPDTDKGRSSLASWPSDTTGDTMYGDPCVAPDQTQEQKDGVDETIPVPLKTADQLESYLGQVQSLPIKSPVKGVKPH